MLVVAVNFDFGKKFYPFVWYVTISWSDILDSIQNLVVVARFLQTELIARKGKNNYIFVPIFLRVKHKTIKNFS